ncbi:hypothetical protein [Christensenella hongkongensis]|jgi:hypothetical protein|nr:hypothetical protein [Christensenella hongkongensis]
MAYEMMINHGMRIDDFLSQDLRLFLRANAAAQEEEITFVDEI